MTEENSKVISFRLNPDIEDERQALAVLERWYAQGFKVRQIVVRALLNLDGLPAAAAPVDLVAELHQAVRESQALVERLRRGGALSQNFGLAGAPVEQSELKPELRAAIKKAVRPGLKVISD